MSHLRFGKEKITSTYLLAESDFISCSKQSYVHQYDLLRGLRKGGTFYLTQFGIKKLSLMNYRSYEKYIAEK